MTSCASLVISQTLLSQAELKCDTESVILLSSASPDYCPSILVAETARESNADIEQEGRLWMGSRTLLCDGEQAGYTSGSVQSWRELEAEDI
mgnify:CR=1 FL=1